MKKENKTHKMFGAYSPYKAGRYHLEWAASLSREHWPPLFISLLTPLLQEAAGNLQREERPAQAWKAGTCLAEDRINRVLRVSEVMGVDNTLLK